MTSQLVVCDTAVRQDSYGYYCLNDLHRAAGGEERHAPALWERQAKGMIAELEKDTDSYAMYKVRGRKGGTYVCKELVYAYAMWISPAFNLKVIRAYDTLQTQGVAVAEHAAEAFVDNPFAFYERLLGQAKVILAERDQARVERDQAKLERDAVVETIGTYTHTINRVVRMFPGVNTTAAKRDLMRLGYLYQIGGVYRSYSRFHHLFTERFDDNGRGNLFCTPEGKALLTRLYAERKLTMKKEAA